MAKKKQNAVIGTFKREDGTIGYLRNNFVFYLTWKQMADKLPDEERLALYDIITDYALYGKLPPEDHPCDIYFVGPRYQIDQMNERYEDGITGGRPSNNKSADFRPGEGGTANNPDTAWSLGPEEMWEKYESMHSDPNYQGFTNAQWGEVEMLEHILGRKFPR